MKKTLLFLFLILESSILFGKSYPDTIHVTPDIQLIQISETFYLHKSYTTANLGRFSSNGLLLVKNNKALMIDTPMTNKDTEIIYNYLRDSLKCTLEFFIGGHFHNDCIGGLEFLNAKGVIALLGEKTNQKCIENNLALPTTTFNENYVSDFEGIEFECSFWGGGHSEDNIVVYFPFDKILFGGCLVKSANSRTMGNTTDAVPEEWATTVQKVKDNYPNVEVVIPGHGNHAGSELLQFTIDLANQFLK